MNKKTAKRLGWIAFIVLNVLVLFFTARADFTADRPPLTLQVSGWLRFVYIAGAVICLILVIGSEAAKYVVMMKHAGERVSVPVAVETVIVGKYFDAITPSGTGGQPAQIWNLHSRGYSHAASAAMPLAGYVAFSYSFILLALIALIFGGNSSDLSGITILGWIGLLGYAGLPTLIMASAISSKTTINVTWFFIRLGARMHIVKNPQTACDKVEGYINQFAEGISYIGNDAKTILKLGGLSILYHVALYSIPFFVMRMLGGDTPYLQSVFACIILYSAVTVVPTPGNAGAAEGTFYLLFSRLNSSGAFWGMLIWRFMTYYIFIILGLGLYAFNALKRRLKPGSAPGGATSPKDFATDEALDEGDDEARTSGQTLARQLSRTVGEEERQSLVQQDVRPKER